MVDPQPADGLETYQVAVVVFASAPGVDARDAAHGVSFALRCVLAGDGLVLPVELPGHPRLGGTVTVADVQEVGMAAGNGYLWTKPTARAFREAGQ